MLCITIHSNLMTFNKVYKTKTVTLSDLNGESSPHLLDTYTHSHLFLKHKLLVVHHNAMDHYIQRCTYEY